MAGMMDENKRRFPTAVSCAALPYSVPMTDPDQYSDAETERRREAALKKMLATPPKPFTPKAKKKAIRATKATKKDAKSG